MTYRKTAPHEYTVREWQPEESAQHQYDRFVEMIRRFGYADFYYRTRLIYWAVDEFGVLDDGLADGGDHRDQQSARRCPGAVEGS